MDRWERRFEDVDGWERRFEDVDRWELGSVGWHLVDVDTNVREAQKLSP